MLKRFFISILLAVKNLRHNVGRTVLTLVGIVIGIMSVIVVMSSGQGVKGYILGQFDSYGTDTIQIETKVPATKATSSQNATGQAMGIQITTLKEGDAEAMEKLPNVVATVPGTIGQELVSYRDQNKKALLFGVGADEPLVDTAVKTSEGVFYTQQENDSLAQVAVIGLDVKNALFGEEDAVGKMVKIKNLNFKVIGVAQKRGAVTFFNYDELIYIPVKTLQKKIMGIDYVRFITVKVKDENMVDVTALDIADLLKKRHNTPREEQEDFSVMTIEQGREIVSSVFGTINILLLALTSISLLVGGVGIMNVMYVAVTERTFEIGLRKAVGARAQDILRQFLLEAIVITLLGGVVGILAGFLLVAGFSYIMSLLGFGISFAVTRDSVLLGAGFSIAVGIIFGYYPAKKASGLSPMEAMRKE